MGIKTNTTKKPVAKAAGQDTVPPGYKRTEAGVIPVDWKVKRLKNVFKLNYGKSQKGIAVEGGLYPIFATSGEVGKTNRFIYDQPSIIIGRKGTIDNPLYVDVPFWAIDTTFYTIIEPDQDPKFLYYSLTTLEWESYNEASGVPSLNANTVLSIPIPLPSLSEQAAIAKALSDVDALTAALDKLIAKKLAIKQAAMQQLLTGKTRLPGFSGEWEVRPFAASLIRVNAKPYQIFARDYQPFGKHPVIDQGQLPVIGFTDRSDKLFLCPSGGVIVFGDHTCIVKFIDNSFVIGADGTQILVTKEEQCTRFYAYLLQHDRVEPTGYNRHFRILRERLFRVPLPPEQRAIATVLSDMDAEIEALEQRRDKTQQIKQGMMQQLLTGRVRLINQEATA